MLSTEHVDLTSSSFGLSLAFHRPADKKRGAGLGNVGGGWQVARDIAREVAVPARRCIHSNFDLELAMSIVGDPLVYNAGILHKLQFFFFSLEKKAEKQACEERI